jgi:aspartyl-tRNA(Asn)/glutamyl-tRNA(Gln) amidotransferase subunit B
VEYIREEMPEPAHIKTDRFVKQYGIKKDDAQVLTSELELADAFEEVVKEVDPEFAALWMRDELKRILSFNKITYKESEITSAQLVEFFKLLLDKKITTKAGQRIIENLPHNPKSPTLIAEDLGLIGVVEEDVVQQAVKQSIEENPEAVSDYYQGKKKALNFLMGQVMRITQGKADPGDIIKLLKGELDK